MSVSHGNLKSGFTLIEINLVLLIVGVALVSLMGLFPVGLREADAAASDTEQAMFAERVLSAIQAKAGAITNAATWYNEDEFIAAVQSGLLDADTRISIEGRDDDILITDYLTDKSYMRYKIDVEQVDEREMGLNSDVFSGSKFKRLYRASVWVSNRKTGNTNNNTPYTTYLFYKGVP